MKYLLHPLVLVGLAVTVFVLGFWGGLVHVGYFNQYTMPKYVPDRRSAEKRAKDELELLRQLTQEFDRIGMELKRRAANLDAREARAKKKESDLELERAAVDKIRAEVAKIQSDLDARLVYIKVSQQENIARLAKIYGSRVVENAAKLLSTLPETQVVQILRKMKDAQTAKIFDAWGKDPLLSKKANRITTLLRSSVDLSTEGQQ